MKVSRVALVLGLAAVSWVAAPSEARAEVKGVKLAGFITYQTTEACAASLEVTQSNGGLTDGTETLKLGLKFSYTFGGGGFAPASGRFGVGERVLFASPAFAVQTGAKVDVEIKDADCMDFNKTGGDITFDGSLGQNPGILKLTVPPAFGTFKALNDTGATIDLKTTPFQFYGYTGSWSLGGPGSTSSSGASGTTSSGGTSGAPADGGASSGTGPPTTTSSSGGCVTAPSGESSGGWLWGAGVVGALFVISRKRRRRA